jgi:hypothetical protein
MSASKSSFLLAVAVLAVLFFPASSLADTYQIFLIGGANSHLIYGIDTSGAVVIQLPNPVSGPDPFLYQTYVDGAITNSSTTIPTLDYDNGTACIPTVSAPITWTPGSGQTRCNNGHEVYFGTFPVPPPQPFGRGIFTGPNLSDHLTDPSYPLVAGSTLDMVALNASGDFAWVDGLQELFYEAVDTTTPAPVPEPSSILLLGTGVLAAAGARCRRVS